MVSFPLEVIHHHLLLLHRQLPCELLIFCYPSNLIFVPTRIVTPFFILHLHSSLKPRTLESLSGVSVGAMHQMFEMVNDKTLVSFVLDMSMTWVVIFSVLDLLNSGFWKKISQNPVL
jgi:hypothetical protein